MSIRKVFVIGCEGEIEAAVELVYQAMMGEAKVQLNFLCTTSFMHAQTLRYMVWYLKQKNAPKVNHVNIDIFIEEETADDIDEPETRLGDEDCEED